MKTIILILAILPLTSCLNSNAEEPKKISINMQAGSFQCASMSLPEACGVRLYDCFDGSGRRFDVVCAHDVTIQKW